jgi:diketogulonate reductase-like aldo/keto reductase
MGRNDPLQIVETHGAKIPAIGFGTWALDGETCARAVRDAIGIGYRHIDTAAGYRNEDRVGEGVRAAGVSRGDIFITTKVAPEELEEKTFKASVERSLKLIGVDQVDLVLIHWPSKTIPVATTIATLNAVRKSGWTRHIGVSNFTVKLLDEAWKATDAPLVTNQCEYHPYLNQDKLRAACFKHGMSFTAFSPLGRRVVLEDPVIVGIAKRKNRTPAQIVLRWDIQQDRTITIPKSSDAAHIKSNFAIFDFALDDAEMAAVTALTKTHLQRVTNPAAVAPDWDTK